MTTHELDPVALEAREPDVSSRWRAIDARFRVAREDARDGDEDAALHVDRDSALVLSAPHGTRHYRAGAMKQADLHTGSLTLLAGELADVSAVVSARAHAPWDSWDERDDPFARHLRELRPPARMVVDIHGMGDHHGPDFCLGTGPRPGPLELLAVEVLRHELEDFDVAVDAPFDARPHYTVTHLAQRHLGLAGLQIEVAARWRSPRDADAAPGAAALARALGAVDAGLRAAA
ncbi:hypothetical protein QQX10_00615 [Demequina sp. SYSU T00039]|uniref:N-formylglutamate amidohydrolase n=1 Tax=Demequina lignilytica TaxID=3051663 RepID=A0AAW7LZI7_9MICO|nr:hypothetical protein [Demequina sp. SYSU T00039]MDN4486664.1 hypothetical protein [Demequina sp. SYSU T00039]